MKRSLVLVLTSLGALSASAAASDLNVRARSGGLAAVTVSPGETVSYSITGELSDAQSLGLAYFVLDLSFDGGDLPQADAPSTANLLNFAVPLGMNNPAGFGGTSVAGDLIQVGGAQNTINNAFATEPVGTVITGIASLGSPEVLVTGSLTVPTAPGSYRLKLSNLRANVIRLGETGFPFWAVDSAGAGDVEDLVINVSALTSDLATLSLAAGGTQILRLDAGAASAGRLHLLLGSASGVTPGLPIVTGVTLPLNVPDAYFDYTLTAPNYPPLGNSFGVLDGNGKGLATFTIPPGSNAALAGMMLNHAFVLVPELDFASNPVPVALLP